MDALDFFGFAAPADLAIGIVDCLKELAEAWRVFDGPNAIECWTQDIEIALRE